MADNDQDYEAYPREIAGLSVYEESSRADVVLSNGMAWTGKRQAKLKAAVDVETGEVRFYIDPADVKKLLPKKHTEPGS